MPNDVKKQVKQIDIYNPEFNHYFTEKLNKITPEQRELLPERLSYKIYRYGFDASAERLTFQEKMWILSVVFKKHVLIMVDDMDNGVNMVDFGKAKRAAAGKLTNGVLLQEMQVKSAFVMSDRELMAAALYMNHVSTSNIYTLVKEIVENTNHKTNQNFVRARKNINEILKYTTHYESVKRKIASDYGMTMSRWYALMYFGQGEKPGKDFYDKDFRHAYSSDRSNLHREMKWLTDNGYLVRRGEKLNYKYSITSAGLNLLNRILDNLVLKY